MIRSHPEGGYRELLALAAPLILSMGAVTVQGYVDRMFLSRWNQDAFAASMPAVMTHFAVLSLFFGAAMYVGTFVSQYRGAGRPERIGPVLWHGAWFSLASAPVVAVGALVADPLFRAFDHGPEVTAYEAEYFSVLCLGSFPMILAQALAGFFSGLGRTWPVMWANVAGTGVNGVVDAVFIFGNYGAPELGVTGAALGTIAAATTTCLVLVGLLRPRHFETEYRVRTGWRLEAGLFRRLLRFGLPNGGHFLLDVAGFNLFLMFVGRIGPMELAATNAAFSINMVAFMPMFGLGTAVAILVGRNLGRERPDLAAASTWRGFKLTLAYMTTVAAAYFFTPGVFLQSFFDGPETNATRDLAEVLLRFVALYSLFDGMNIIFASGVKGAGDTRWVMVMTATLSTTLLVVPTGIAVESGAGIFTAWWICTIYVVVLASTFCLRFLGGRWRTMRVIEPHA